MHPSESSSMTTRLLRAFVAVTLAAAVGFVVSELSPELRPSRQPDVAASGADVMAEATVDSVPAGISEIEAEPIVSAPQSTLQFAESLGADAAEPDRELTALIEGTMYPGLLDRVAFQGDARGGLLAQASAAYRWMAQSRPWNSL